MGIEPMFPESQTDVLAAAPTPTYDDIVLTLTYLPEFAGVQLTCACCTRAMWSDQWELNPRPLPPQGNALPD